MHGTQGGSLSEPQYMYIIHMIQGAISLREPQYIMLMIQGGSLREPQYINVYETGWEPSTAYI